MSDTEEKLQAVLNVMKNVLRNGPLSIQDFRTNCFTAFSVEFTNNSDVQFAKSSFGPLREENPPFEKANGMIRLVVARKRSARRRGVTVAATPKKRAAPTPAAVTRRRGTATVPQAIAKKSQAAKKSPARSRRRSGGDAATKKEVIERIDELLKDELSQKEIGMVLSALENVIVEELVDKEADKFRITRVLTLEVDRSKDSPSLSVRPLSRLEDFT